ncbi:MAG: hypothetical protein MJZ34_07275 [Paludibacteraceae bacterium]|nr:hypothetical protein [Paludibacteraceae bacterium]
MIVQNKTKYEAIQFNGNNVDEVNAFIEKYKMKDYCIVNENEIKYWFDCFVGWQTFPIGSYLVSCDDNDILVYAEDKFFERYKEVVENT